MAEITGHTELNHAHARFLSAASSISAVRLVGPTREGKGGAPQRAKVESRRESARQVLAQIVEPQDIHHLASSRKKPQDGFWTICEDYRIRANCIPTKLTGPWFKRALNGRHEFSLHGERAGNQKL